MKKIVITGGLGYIGTELCKIYSGYSWNKNTVIDNRFISERVNQIENEYEFCSWRHIDKNLIKKHCEDVILLSLGGYYICSKVQAGK